MAGEQRRESEMWKIGGEMNPFEEEQKPTSSSSGWNLNLAGVSAGENLFHGPDVAVMSHLAQSHGSSIFGSSEWSIDRGAQPQERSGGGGCGGPAFSDLMDIDVGFDSAYMSFTQCLQAGLHMDAADYTAVSKTLGIMGRDHHFAEQYNMNAASSSNDRTHESSSAARVFDFAASPLAEAGDLPNAPTTPNSSTSLSSAEGNDDVSAAASSSGAAKDQAALATQADQAPRGASASSVPDQEESQDKLSGDSKKVNKPRKKGQKRNREPRFAFMTKSDVDHLEDGYRWRKYGQKAVKNSPYPRSYYRCTNAKCSVKKRVERSFEDPTIVITTYEGQHTHQSPALLRGSGGGGGGGAGIGSGGGGGVSDHGHFAGNTSSFTQSAFDFPSLQMMVQVPPRTTITTTSSTFDLIQQQQTVMPSPHPALQRSHPHQGAHNLPDHGLLEDIVPSGMRKPS